ncbi:MAG: Mur ligase domain-containing protein [Eubacterium ventriosum]
MKLKDLLTKLEYKVVKGSDTIEVSHLQNDSRKVSDGDAFVCIKGAGFDGHEFIRDVVSKGAVAVVVMEDVEVDEDVTVVKVDDTRLALACMSADYFGNPAEKLITVGITGTKGKTTTTYWFVQYLKALALRQDLLEQLKQ